jgi:hypothetical protein
VVGQADLSRTLQERVRAKVTAGFVRDLNANWNRGETSSKVRVAGYWTTTQRQCDNSAQTMENLTLELSELEKMQPDELVSLSGQIWDVIRGGGQVEIIQSVVNAPPKQLLKISSRKEHDNFTRLMARDRFGSIYSAIDPKRLGPST